MLKFEILIDEKFLKKFIGFLKNLNIVNDSEVVIVKSVEPYNMEDGRDSKGENKPEV